MSKLEILSFVIGMAFFLVLSWDGWQAYYYRNDGKSKHDNSV